MQSFDDAFIIVTSFSTKNLEKTKLLGKEKNLNA